MLVKKRKDGAKLALCRFFISVKYQNNKIQ